MFNTQNKFLQVIAHIATIIACVVGVHTYCINYEPDAKLEVELLDHVIIEKDEMDLLDIKKIHKGTVGFHISPSISITTYAITNVGGKPIYDIKKGGNVIDSNSITYKMHGVSNVIAIKITDQSADITLLVNKFWIQQQWRPGEYIIFSVLSTNKLPYKLELSSRDLLDIEIEYTNYENTIERKRSLANRIPKYVRWIIIFLLAMATINTILFFIPLIRYQS